MRTRNDSTAVNGSGNKTKSSFLEHCFVRCVFLIPPLVKIHGSDGIEDEGFSSRVPKLITEKDFKFVRTEALREGLRYGLD